VVSDLGLNETLQIATALAPALRNSLDGSGGTAKSEATPHHLLSYRI
jgi:hypothetical protein